jgi:prepilin-type N-terminal cleavage/methylation domain-containing protein
MSKTSGDVKKSREAIDSVLSRKTILGAEFWLSEAAHGVNSIKSMNARHTLPKRPAAAFTLIELLTVIAIIAVLMGLLFPALSGAKEQARRADAGTNVRNIVAACKSYYNDYGKFPPVTGALDGDVNTNGYYSFGDTSAGKCKVENSTLFDILRSINRGENNSYALNKRQQKYFEMGKAKDTKNPRGGFCDGNEFTKSQGALMDPWGAQYCVVLDADDDGTIDMGAFYSDLAGAQNAIRASAVCFSMGKDNIRGGKGYEGKFRPTKSGEAPDDVVSWQ